MVEQLSADLGDDTALAALEASRPVTLAARGAERVGLELTENFAMTPAASVSGFYFAHREARYFAVGKIGRDQVLDYQQRKQMPLPAVERWLAPILAYEPEEALVTSRT